MDKKKRTISLRIKFVFYFSIIIAILLVDLVATYSLEQKYSSVVDETTEALEFANFLSERIIDHEEYVMNTMLYMTGNSTEAKVSAHTECNLGKWYYSATPDPAYESEFNAIDASHKALHDASIEIKELMRQVPKK